MRVLLFFVFDLLFILTAHSQQNQISAESYLKNKNYSAASLTFKKQFATTADSNLLKKIGNAYLKADNDRTKSIKYFQNYLIYNPKDKDIWYKLIFAHLYQYDIEKAKTCLDTYSALTRGKKKKIKTAFEIISRFEAFYFNPENVSITNVGNKINTSASEDFPIIDNQHRYLVYESNKLKSKGKVQLNGELNNDLYISRYNGTSFTLSKPIKKLNSIENEKWVGYQDNLKSLYFIKRNLPILIAQKRGLNYKKKGIIHDFDHLKGLDIHSIFISLEEEKAFISARPHGKKQVYQLYQLNLLPDNNWSKPVALNITNKSSNYINPFYHSYTNTLYFSSDVNEGMGGFDLYSSHYNRIDQNWDDIENLGYPINSPYDEKNISLTQDGSSGFFSSIREGGFGKYDIYKISYLNEPVRRVIYLVDFLDPNTQKAYDNLNLEIYSQDDVLIGKYLPNNQTGVFTIILEEGEFQIIGKVNSNIIFEKQISVSEYNMQEKLIRINL